MTLSSYETVWWTRGAQESPHFLIQLIQQDSELSPQRGAVSSALKSVRLCDGQSVRPCPVLCVVFSVAKTNHV